MVGAEHFDCANCDHVGALDIHGACEACGSRAVMSTATRPVMATRLVPVYFRPVTERPLSA